MAFTLPPRMVFLPALGIAVLLAAGFIAHRASHAPRSADPSMNRVSIREEGEARVIEANGIPDHTTGLFPNANDPFPLRAQAHRFRVPLHPQPNAESAAIGVVQFGVAVNGVPFDPAGPFLRGDQASGWEFEPLHASIGPHLGVDEHHAHVQPSGAYHYHGLPTGLYQRLAAASDERQAMILVGWAADGFPIYGPFGHDVASDAASPLRPMRSSYRLRQGLRPPEVGGSFDGSFIQDYEYVPGLGDLDECNGCLGPTPEFPAGTYHYHLTADFPVVPRRFRGTPDASFGHPGGGPGPGELPPGLRDFPRLSPPNG